MSQAHLVFSVSGLLTLISALLCIRAYYQNNRTLVYIFKPLTTVIIISTALWLNGLNEGIESNYGLWIILGLIFSLAGDIFLMLPRDRFIQGLVSFLLAHLIYILAFTNQTQSIHLTMLLFFLFAGWLLARLVLPYAKSLKIPVAIYMSVILTMAWRACEWSFSLPSQASLLATAGSLIFVVSDLTLALNRFRNPFKSAEAIILSTYFVAQWLIAISIS